MILSRQLEQPRYAILAESLFQEILSGKYPVGSRLPVEKDLAAHYDVAIMTVRQGVGLLVKKGIVERVQGRGTFVKKASVQLAHVAVLFGASLVSETAHYYRQMLRHLQDAMESRNWRCRYYDRLNPIADTVEVSSAQAALILSDHHNDPLSGLIEIAPPQESAIPRELRHLPKSRISFSYEDTDILVDMNHMARECIRQLVKRGVKRVFYFGAQWDWEKLHPIVEGIQQEAQARRLPDPVIHKVIRTNEGYEHEKAIYGNFQSLLREWEQHPEQVPDGMLFNDDMVLRCVAPLIVKHRSGLLKEVRFTTLGSEDVRFHYGFPVIRYEVSPREIAAHLVDVLDKRMQGDFAATKQLRHRGKVFLEE